MSRPDLDLETLDRYARQIVMDDVGRPKVDSAAEFVADVNPAVTIKPLYEM